MGRRNYDNPNETELAQAWQQAFEDEKKSRGGNPLVEMFRHVLFVNKKGRTVELIGMRDTGEYHQVKDSKLPQEFEIIAEAVLGTGVDYNQALEKIRQI